MTKLIIIMAIVDLFILAMVIFNTKNMRKEFNDWINELPELDSSTENKMFDEFQEEINNREN